MKANKWMLSTIALAALLIAITAGACTAAGATTPDPLTTQAHQTAAPVPTPSPVSTTAESHVISSNYYHSGWNKYTKADYDLAMSFKVNGWEKMSVADFNAKLLNVSDEAAYHKVESSLVRVVYTLGSKDPNADFLLGALANSLAECRVAHYNACVHDQLPSWDGSVSYTRYADVYGDKVATAEAYGNYWFRYPITDPAKVTVAQRDAFLQNVDKDMQAFLDKQTEDAIVKRESMTKALKAELERLTKEYGGGSITAKDCDVDYQWDDFS